MRAVPDLFPIKKKKKVVGGGGGGGGGGSKFAFARNSDQKKKKKKSVEHTRATRWWTSVNSARCSVEVTITYDSCWNKNR